VVKSGSNDYVEKNMNNMHWTRMLTSLPHISMHTFAAPVGGQKEETCIHFSKWYCYGNIMSHNWNLWCCDVSILVQCIFYIILQIKLLPILTTILSWVNFYSAYVSYILSEWVKQKCMELSFNRSSIPFIKSGIIK